MKLSLDNARSHLRIDAYSADSVTISNTDYAENLILTAEQVIENWQINDIANLTLDELAPVTSMGLEVLLLGTGEKLTFPPPKLMAELAALGVGLEVMDTAAACRTFNILVSEDRRVGAALVLK